MDNYACAARCSEDFTVQGYDERVATFLMKLSLRLVLSLASIVCLLQGMFVHLPAQSPVPQAAGTPNLSAAAIVSEMQAHNRSRAAGLKAYRSLRHYSLEYSGMVKLSAQMEVEADYDAASGKSFRIVSQSGSKMLVEKVLKRLLESEKDASDHHSAELSAENYTFRLLGMEDVSQRPAYVLQVEPRTANKYLYRGKIWVDAAEFALERIEAEPAKRPSFWISSTAIHHRFERTEGFWLPVQNLSETRVRVGGKAVLTIRYDSYRIVPVAPVAAGGN